MAETQIAGKKRHSPDTPASGEEAQANKKRKIRRTLQHVQPRPARTEAAPQDPVFIQGQLLRSISAALAIAGFDSAKPSALEMFRGAVEEYMLQFLETIRTSMRTSRRTKPTAQDFATALSLIPNTSSASLLAPQLQLDLPSAISNPAISSPTDPPPSPPSDFSKLLEPLMVKSTPSYIPKHFPRLPPQHAWKQTPMFPAREHDARKMRERATEEGILAEQALRKLAAAAKSGAVKAERRRKESTLSGPGKKVDGRRGKVTAPANEDMYGDMLKEVVGAGAVEDVDEMDQGLSLDGVNEMRRVEQGVDLGMPEGVLVNSDMGGWRKGGKRGLRS